MIQNFADLNWKRGLNRLYIVGIAVWVLYWILWVPHETMQSMQYLASTTQDETLSKELWAQANYPAQWASLWGEVASYPLESALLLLLPPIFVYLAIWGCITLLDWLRKGFFGQ